MRKVTLYIECSSTYMRKKLRMTGYVLEYITASGVPVTGQAFREGDGTYNQEVLLALAEALGHIKEPCELTICSSNRFVLNMIRDRLKTWAKQDFTSNGSPIMFRKEWKDAWEKIKEHKVSTQIGKHSYSGWLLTEMEGKNDKDTENTKRNKTQGDCPADGGSLPKTQGLPGQLYG